MRPPLFPVLGILLAGSGYAISNPEEYVDIRQGTYTLTDWSNGNTLPLLGLPWGQAYWGPETYHSPSFGTGWWFNPRWSRINGIRCTHQPSPWINDWGTFAVRFGFLDEGWDSSQGYDPRLATFKPYHFGTELYGMSNEQGRARVDLTAGTHSSHIRFRYPPNDSDKTDFNQTRYIRIHVPWNLDGAPMKVVQDETDTKVLAGSKQFTGGIHHPDGYLHRLVASFTPKPDWWTITGGTAGSSHTSFYAYYETAQEVNLRFGLSLIEHALAVDHLAQVAGTFDENMQAHKDVWREQLSVIDVVDSGMANIVPKSPLRPARLGEDEDHTMEMKMLINLYTGMYRCSMFPRDLSEWKNGVLKHWSPYHPEGGIFDGHLMTDSGFWDAYHTVYTLMGLLWPDQVPVVMEGYINAWKEGGWVPQWSSPGYRSSMVGTLSDASLSDMIVKGFGGFEMRDALGALHTNAFDPPASNESNRGRSGLEDYTRLGYIAKDSKDARGGVHEVISQTLNHAFSDHAILQAVRYADTFGVFSMEERDLLLRRSYNHEQIWNPTRGFYQGKWKNGTWAEPWDEFMWGGDLTEGGPWQFRFGAAHHVKEVYHKQFGGAKSFCERLVDMNIQINLVHRDKDHYGQLIHEMLEVPLNVWGQNSHNNQPSHHSQWLPIHSAGDDGSLYDACIKPAHYWIKKTLVEAYSPKRYSGDEDNGEMGGWFVLAAMGLYDPVPGTPEYTLASPLFKEIHVKLGSSTLKIVNLGDVESCLMCGSRSNSLGSNLVTLEQLRSAGTLSFSQDITEYVPPASVDPFIPPTDYEPHYEYPWVPPEVTEEPESLAQSLSAAGVLSITLLLLAA